ncbi:hypothetical protein ACFW1A_38005 [Kitasatospora sp. NPDC058965]|uniref:hypothetical protein n=1 Tax=Kitasatospora sp. NPDC058965 TaxID=3346682 RepID=UPI0036885161
MSMRTLALPALAASTLLAFCGCDLPSAAASTPTAARAGESPQLSPGQHRPYPAEPATAQQAAATDGSSTPSATATFVHTPSAAPSSAPPRTTAAHPIAVPTANSAAHPATTVAPPATGPARATLASPTGTGTAAPAGAPALTLSSYDAAAGRAVLTATGAGAAGSADTAAVRPGQLIDSPPTPAAPHGALVAVTGVQQQGGGKVAVTTRPATLPELLGGTDAGVRAPVAPASISVQPQIGDLKVAYDVTGITSANGSASGSLGLTANATVPLPNGASATLAGSVELDPEVDFSYQGGAGILAPQQARVGFTLGAHADWHVSAGLTATGTPIKIPIAKLSASPVVMVGVLPVVINLDLTLSADIAADGTVTVDAEQSYDGSWGVHSDYAQGAGWTTSTDPSSSAVSPLKLDLAGSASVRTGLAAEASVALYDAVGVKASIEPYLRTAVNGSVVLDGTGSGPAVNGSVSLFGGLDINGELFARIALLGTTLAEQDLPFLAYHQEWPIKTWSTAAAPAALPGATAKA